jgi:hypothetical protein
MLDVECSVLNENGTPRRWPHSTFNIQHLTINILLFLLAFPLLASDFQTGEKC